MLNYDTFEHDSTLESIVDVICAGLGTDERSFFRVHVAYYFAMTAATMRCYYHEPGNNVATRPVNSYAVNLAPSGFGKGYSTDVLEDQVIHKFRERFLSETWPTVTLFNIGRTAEYRARKDQSDPEEMTIRVGKEFDRQGSYEFSFSKPTDASIIQLRQKLLLAGIGSINSQVDEIAMNIHKLRDSLPSFLELFDGKLKNNLTKNTADQQRSEAMFGKTPANVMWFGVPNTLLDNSKNEQEFEDMLEQGLGRRAIFGYVSDEQYDRYTELLTPERQLEMAKAAQADSKLGAIADQFEALADPIKVDTRLTMPDDTALLMYAYKNDCKRRAIEIPVAQNLLRYEVEHRFAKAIRYAAAFAFVNSSPEISVGNLESAIALVEESGDAFARMMHRDLPPVKLAKHLGSCNQELTKVSLRAQLPYFKGGTKQSRDEMLAEAIDWGYTNNIAIRRRFSNGVEFYSGTQLKSNDLTKLRISFSQEQAYNYTSQEITWDQMAKLSQIKDVHWVNHLLENGFDHVGHRTNDECIAGFNLVVLDVDNTGENYITIQEARSALNEYKAFYYCTKRHTPEHHRFRIVMPINYTLELDGEDFAEFMRNFYEWLPFESDDATGQRSRKWMSNDGHYMFTDGKLLDALPFIPRTNKQLEYAERLVDLANMGGIERWFILNTSYAQENRNKNLLRYALMLVDGGLDSVGIRDKLLCMNNKLDRPMKDEEFDRTIMQTVTKKIQARNP